MTFSRRHLLAMLPAAARLAAAPSKEPLNVVFIVSDDLNVSLGCYGNTIVKTPNLDRLASKGVRFDHAYCQFPLCAPSRASFLSGRRPDSTRVLSLTVPLRKHMPAVTMLPELFRKQGYFTAQTGKIFHTGAGHEDPQSWDFMMEDREKNPPRSEVVASQKEPEPRNHSMAWAQLSTPEETTADGLQAGKACELIRQSTPANKPFFLGVGFRRPHSPYAAPKKYFDLYRPSEIPVPAQGDRSNLLPAAWYELEKQRPLSAKQTQEYTAAYYACTSAMDAQVGRVLQTLDELKLRDRTVVIFLGDHGYHTGQHGMWHKMTLFEESARVPLLIHAPGRKSNGTVCPGLVELVDLYPTLTELCGLPAPAGLEGKSLTPLLDDSSRPGREAVFTMVGRNDDRELSHKNPQWFGRSVRTARWRYTEWDGGTRGVELYDERIDPHEMKNLAQEDRLASVRAELRRLLNSMTTQSNSAAAGIIP